MPLLRKLSAAIAAAGALGPVQHAHALRNDRLELFVSETVTHDDNVFRLPGGVDPTPVLGTGSAADTYRTTSIGFTFDVPVSRQRLNGGLALNQARYRRFSALDLDGHAGRLTWHWQAGNAASGELSYTDSRTLASLANVQSGIQSSTPNFLRARNAVFNGTYGLGSPWRLRAEVSRFQQLNSVAEREVNDLRVDAAEIVAGYASRAENQIGFSVRLADGRLPNRLFVGSLLVDNSYRQRHLAAILEWTPTGKTRLTARAGRVYRDHDQLPQRDFEAAMYRAKAEWQPTGKLTFTAIGQRDISATEEINVGFVFVEGFAIYPAWRLTEKLNLTAGFEQADRRYLGDPGLVLGTVGPRSERVRAATLNLAYRPLRPLLVVLGWRRETRSANVAFGDYEASIYSIGARLGF